MSDADQALDQGAQFAAVAADTVVADRGERANPVGTNDGNSYGNSDGTSDAGSSFQPPQPPQPWQPSQVQLPQLAPPVFAPPAGSPPLFVPGDDAPNATVVPTNTVGKRGKGKVVGGLIAVAALLGAGGFAVSRIVSGDEGGAANPTEVGTRLMDAFAAEDVLGVVDLLLPGERETMRQPLIDFVDHLKRLGIADSTADLEKVGGLDITFDDVQVEPTATNVDDVSDIRITATSSVTVDGEKVPIGDLLIDEAFGGERPDMSSSVQSDTPDIDWRMATVKRDGRWYLSAFYSIAENARADGDDIPTKGIVAHGADTPEGAVQAIFDAADDLDLEALIAALNPNEAEALQRYAPMFLDDAQRALDDVDVKVAFSDVKLSSTGSGDRRTVTIDGFKMHGSSNGEDMAVESKGDCAVATIGDTTVDTCAGGSSIDSAITMFGLDENEDVQALIKTVRDAFADLKPLGLTVQQVDGKWFFSPIGTSADVYLAVLAALDKDELTDIIDGIKKVAESFSPEDIFFPGQDTSSSGDPGTSDPGTTDPGTTDPGTTDPGTSDPGSGASGLDACYAEFDYGPFAACIAAGLDDHSIDSTSVAPYFRFAECGVGEAYFHGDVYTMSDEEFTAFATAAAPCFQKYVEDGTILQFELPFELSRPDCLEGKNWYNSSDTAYNDRVFACAI